MPIIIGKVDSKYFLDPDSSDLCGCTSFSELN